MYNCKSSYVQAIYKCCLRLDYSKTKEKKREKRKEIKIALSLGYPSSYFYNKSSNNGYIYHFIDKVAAFCQCQCHSTGKQGESEENLEKHRNTGGNVKKDTGKQGESQENRKTWEKKGKRRKTRKKRENRRKAEKDYL